MTEAFEPEVAIPALVDAMHELPVQLLEWITGPGLSVSAEDAVEVLEAYKELFTTMIERFGKCEALCRLAIAAVQREGMPPAVDLAGADDPAGQGD